MPLLKGNLHAHTTFSDGALAPHRLVEEYERLGYDFLAITDHDDLVGEAYWQALERLAPRLVLFHGVELSYTDFPQHVGKVMGERETLYVLNHPARYRLSLEETLQRIQTIRAAGLPVEAIEVTDTGLYRPLYHTMDIPLVKVATDDAHKPIHFGRAWIEVEAAPDRDAIIRAIRAGDCQLGFRQPELPS
jgi:predicted metal-dependent phosphoesterase TrpH